MKTYILITLLALLFPLAGRSQSGKTAPDTTKVNQLEEVVIISRKSLSEKMSKPLSSLDNYLEKAAAVNMIRRGSYAWEPYINGMASERSVITIDGMRIYGACTDKMDPVSSYVEITNLSKANVHSGPAGLGGATIAGSLDLVRKKGSFLELPAAAGAATETIQGNALPNTMPKVVQGTTANARFSGNAFGGFESNNQQKIAGTALAWSAPRLFTNVDFTYRDAGNYKAGRGSEVLYSQFTKYNLSAIGGYKINPHQQVEVSMIYDRASHLGYPALPMDVALAKAFIGSVEYIRHHLSPAIALWQSKIYYNDVTHIMDDSQRPQVPIRMDMPGWSKTAGFYSQLQGNFRGHVLKAIKTRAEAGAVAETLAETGARTQTGAQTNAQTGAQDPAHSWKAGISGHFNQSLAEMTMHANNPAEKDMFMLTWPGVHTAYLDLFAEDNYHLNTHWKLQAGAGIALHHNSLYNSFGWESLRIFYPDVNRQQNRLLKRASTSVQYEQGALSYGLGLAYGDRAPGVSEGYGFYLFNSFDRFDYIGNPHLKNEQSISWNANVAYHRPQWLLRLSAASFYIQDYIIGIPEKGLSTMTIGAAGVKIYQQLAHARLFNVGADMNYHIAEHWLWNNQWSYRRGTASEVGNLPLIQPFSYMSELNFTAKTYHVAASVNGAARQKRYNPAFGEKGLPAYAVYNLSASNRFTFGQQSLLLKVGVENLLDKKYSTFADWNQLPRMGRNLYVNVVWGF